MHRVDTSTAVTVLPSSEAQGTPGFFSKGSVGGFPATIPGQDWFNMVQEELVALLTALGGTPDQTKADYQQISSSLIAKLSSISSIGVDQTWQDVTTSRAFSTTYTNTTGRPIVVAVTVSNTVASSTVSGTILVNGEQITTFNTISSGSIGFTRYTVSGIVPPGSTYSFSVTQASKNNWFELR